MTVTLSTADDLMTITLAAPDGGNAIGLRTALRLADAIAECRRSRPRVILLLGLGRSFSVGGDLAEFGALPASELAPHLLKVTAALHDAVATLVELPIPVVAGVEGNIAGAGVSLMCAADLVIAATDATFTLAYTAIGYTPDSGATWTLPRLVGWRRAAELLLTNRRLTAVDALDWGLITALADEGLPVGEAAYRLAVRLASGPAGALGATARLLRDSAGISLCEALAEERRSIAASASSAEGQEGLAAFLAKRSAEFRTGPP
jgi:2-(1,2-epoxy-1,2-dihydrophenyl)acetyl-CoA isomerase